MAPTPGPTAPTAPRLPEFLTTLFPGFLVSVVIAVAAQFLSDHYGAPAMLMALLLGIAFHFLAEDGRCVEGINVTARQVLRFGVALLGARISVELLIGLGPGLITLVIAGVVLTILFGLLGARLLNRGWRFALLTGGAVAICGASAALAISAVLPPGKDHQRFTLLTVVGVTTLSTVAMVVYPLVVGSLVLDARGAAIFLGGSIHDVAQVVGAGFMISAEVGEGATLVKLLRVALLVPVFLTTPSIPWLATFVGEGIAYRPLLLAGVHVSGFLLAVYALTFCLSCVQPTTATVVAAHDTGVAAHDRLRTDHN